MFGPKGEERRDLLGGLVLVMWTQINPLLWVWAVSREPGAPSVIAKGDPGFQAPWAGNGLGTGCFCPEVSQRQLDTDYGWKEKMLVAA